MMPDKKLSVNDILSEMELSRAKAEHRTTPGDMQRVDEVIRDILTQQHADMMQRENRQATEQEKADLEREIRIQTKTLTKQFVKLKKEQEKQRREQQKNIVMAPPPPVKLKNVGHIRVDGEEPDAISPDELFREVEEARKPPRVPEHTPDEPRIQEEERHRDDDLHNPLTTVAQQPAQVARQHEIADHHEYALPKEGTGQSELARAQRNSAKSNTGRVKAEMGEINGHFGNFRMEDNSVEDSYAKTEITLKNFKELKTSRNKKVDAFVLEKKGQPEQKAVDNESAEEEIEDETSALQMEAERRIQSKEHVMDQDDEYYSPEQNDEISGSLQELHQRLKMMLIVLGAIGINAFLLSFVTTSSSALLLFGRFLLSPLMYSVINAALLAASLIVGRDLFRNVAESFRKKEPCRDLYYLVAVGICLAVNIVFCFRPGKLLLPGVHLYTPVAVLLLFMNFVSHYQTISKTVSNFKFITSEGDKFVVAPVEDLRIAKGMTKGAVDTEPVLVKNVKTGFIERFLSRSFASDASDDTMQKALYVAAPLSILLAVLGWYLTKDVFIALTMLTGTLVLAGSFVGAVMVSFPLLDSGDIVRRFKGMTPDYDSIVAFQDVNSLMINGSDLFTKEAIRLQSVKTFQGKRIDDVIIDAASVVCAANSALRHVFLEILNNAEKLLRPVDSLQYEDLMGISAWVGEKRVLIGNRELMINHSIPVPKKEFEKQFRDDGYEIVYLATEGELAAAFILDFVPDRETSNIVRMLEKNGVVLIVKTVDSCVTAELLAKQFQLDIHSFKILPSHLHKDYDEETAPCEQTDSMLGNNGTTFGYIVSLAVTKKLHGCIRLGTMLYLVSALCGIALLTALLVLGNLASFGTMQMLLFMGAFLLAYWVYEKNMRL